MSTDLDRPTDAVTERPSAPRKRRGGPRPQRGGDGSNEDSLRHELMARKAFPVGLAALIKKKTTALTRRYCPTSEYEVGLVAQMARASAQIALCSTLKLIDLQRTRDRTVLCWDSDRSVYIDELGARLSEDPEGVKRALERTKQGVEWLLIHLYGLLDVLESNGTWDERPSRLASNLLCTRSKFRQGCRKPAAEAEDLAALVAREVDRLETRLEDRLLDRDRSERGMAEVGAPMEEDADSQRLRRFEASARKEYRRARAELLESRGVTAAPRGGFLPPRPAAVTSSSAPRTRPVLSSEGGKFLVSRWRVACRVAPHLMLQFGARGTS